MIKGSVKGSVLNIVYFPPSFLWRYKRWFRQPRVPIAVSDGMKTDETCRFEKCSAQKLNGLSIRPQLVGCPREQLSSLVGRGRVRPHLEEGRNAGAHPERKRIRGSGKTAHFKPATCRGFRNVAETAPDARRSTPPSSSSPRSPRRNAPPPSARSSAPAYSTLNLRAMTGQWLRPLYVSISRTDPLITP